MLALRINVCNILFLDVNLNYMQLQLQKKKKKMIKMGEEATPAEEKKK